jgi:hypothetical protein
MAWYLKYYECSECSTKWTDEWSCTCNDRCPNCRAETEPYDDEDLTYVMKPVAPNTFKVVFSPDSAENSPDYETIGVFKNKAEAFALVTARQDSLSADEFPES